MARVRPLEEQRMTPEELEKRELLLEAARQKKYHDALVAFQVPDEKSIKRAPRTFSKCPVPEIDEYFEHVCKRGKPIFKWELIRTAFLWKLEQAMSDMSCFEAETFNDDCKEAASSEEELRQQHDFIMTKAKEFDGTPFTFQRLCELLTSPSRHYKRADKYLRALEKCINVVTTITETGERVTGVEDFPISEPVRGIEQPFFVQVDECDTPVEAKIAAANERARDNSTAINKEGEATVATVLNPPHSGPAGDTAKDDEVKETSTSPKVIDGNDEPTRKAAKSNGGEVNENEKETKTEEEQNKKETMEE